MANATIPETSGQTGQTLRAEQPDSLARLMHSVISTNAALLGASALLQDHGHADPEGRVWAAGELVGEALAKLQGVHDLERAVRAVFERGLTTERELVAVAGSAVEIRADLPSCDVLEKAQCYLCAAMDVVKQVAAHGGVDSTPWAAVYLIEIAHTAIESVLASRAEERHDSIAPAEMESGVQS